MKNVVDTPSLLSGPARLEGRLMHEENSEVTVVKAHKRETDKLELGSFLLFLRPREDAVRKEANRRWGGKRRGDGENEGFIISSWSRVRS